jgi:hypothetical protein
MKPYEKAQLIKLEGLLDRRRRLTDQDKDKIRELYATGKYGHRPLARMFHVSRSLIRIVVDPDCAKRVKDRFKAHWKDYAKKRTKEMHAAAIRNVRNYKYGLYKAGTIGEEQEDVMKKLY